MRHVPEVSQTQEYRHVQEGRKKNETETEATQNTDEAVGDFDDDTLFYESENTDSQQFSSEESEEQDDGPALPMELVEETETEQSCCLREVDQAEGRPTKKSSNNGKSKKHAVEDLDDLMQPHETALQDSEVAYPDFENILTLIEELGMTCEGTDSFVLLKIQDAIYSYQQIIELEEGDCPQCSTFIEKIARLKNNISEAEEELSEVLTVTSELEQRRIARKEKIYNLRCVLQEEEEKSRNYDQLYEQFKEQLREKEEECNKQVEATKQLEISLRTLDTKLRTTRNKLNQVSAAETEEELKHEYCRMKEKITMMRQDIDTIKHQEEKEKKYLEDIEVLREKHHDLQRTIKLNEETLTQTTLHYNEQISIMKADLGMQSFNQENEEENTETLETEVSTHPIRLAAAPHHHDESQTAERARELIVQGARNEGFSSQDKENFDVSNLTVGNELLPQQLSRSEIGIGSLEHERYPTVDSLRKVTFDFMQTQGQREEREDSDQEEESQGNKNTENQEWMEKRLSQPQSEFTLFQQKLHDLRNKVENEEDAALNSQDQFHDTVNLFQAQTENPNLRQENSNMDLISKYKKFKKEPHQYEKMEAERETQAAVPGIPKQLRENNDASVRSQMELRINNLESELCEMKMENQDTTGRI